MPDKKENIEYQNYSLMNIPIFVTEKYRRYDGHELRNVQQYKNIANYWNRLETVNTFQSFIFLVSERVPGLMETPFLFQLIIMILVPALEHFRRISAGYATRFDITHYHGAGLYDRTFAYGYSA